MSLLCIIPFVMEGRKEERERGNGRREERRGEEGGAGEAGRGAGGKGMETRKKEDSRARFPACLPCKN